MTGGNLKKITPSQAIEIAELREQGWSYIRLGKRYGVTPGAIHYQCLRQGAVSPNSTGPQRHMAGKVIELANGRTQLRFTEAQDQELLDLRRQDLPIREICRRTGRPRTSVRLRLLALAMHPDMEVAHG